MGALGALDAADGGGPAGVDAGVPRALGKDGAGACERGACQVGVDAVRPLGDELLAGEVPVDRAGGNRAVRERWKHVPYLL